MTYNYAELYARALDIIEEFDKTEIEHHTRDEWDKLIKGELKEDKEVKDTCENNT